MLFTSILSAFLFAGLALHPVIATPGGGVLEPRRTSSILNNPAAQPDLPTPPQASQAAAAASLNLDNIQGDILIGMKKNIEVFYFFKINNAKTFKSLLRALAGTITTTTQLLDVNKQPNAAVNIAFSHTGLTALGVNDTLGDPAFTGGQFADAANLGDPGTSNWVSAFAGTNIHGVFLLASDSILLIDAQLVAINLLLGSSISKVYQLQGQARPGDQLGHEHFGFMDGISQPGITGFTANPVPGQTVIDPGHILLGEAGDTITRPAWAKDGSFLAFRQLKQLVPEFNKFLTDNPIIEPGLTRQQGSDLLGARMVGRWKSGAPVDLAPLFDDPVLAADPQRNNNFTFAHPGEDITSNQTRCPFSAHIRKTAPRADFNPTNVNNHIIRAGIPYGPEVSSQEAAKNTTITERGLAFVAYQSNIGAGFQFLQHSWADNVNFIFGKNDSTPGFDPIIGANAGQARFVSGLDPTNSSRDFTLVTDFVQSRGGEYFFSPSITAIKTVLTT
ncbi:dye-decolorizing peroxidase precursor [Ramaria rubella]|nr:dye-decolorizing peroxidase precursor [Ramaria rubella]